MNNNHYLGDDMEEVRSRTVHEEESLTEIPILSLAGVVLLPGQILPLHLFQPHIVAMLRHVVDKDKTFGLVNSRYLGHDYGPTLADIGTTAEIYSTKTEENSGITTIRVKAIGRQRFQIKEKRRSIDGYLGHYYGPTLANIGTTAEIYSTKTEGNSGITTIRVKAIGRQRFQIKEKRRSIDGYHTIHGKIQDFIVVEPI